MQNMSKAERKRRGIYIGEWIRYFKCKTCGNVHMVVGRRMKLDTLQNDLEEVCKTESVKHEKGRLLT